MISIKRSKEQQLSSVLQQQNNGKPETPPSIFEVLMEGEENVNMDDLIPMDFPDPLPIIPPCVSEDLENICRDLEVEEEIVTVFEDVPTTQPTATTSTPSALHHPFKGPSTSVNLLDRPRIAPVIDKMKTAFKGSTPPSSSDKPRTASTSTRTFKGPSASHCDEVIIESVHWQDPSLSTESSRGEKNLLICARGSRF